MLRAKNVGIKVSSVWPGDHSQFGFDANLSEVVGIPHRLEDSPAAQVMRQIDRTLNILLEFRTRPLIAE